MANCVLCGAELVEGKCPNLENHAKRMCLNCTFFSEGVCTNEDNMLLVKENIMKSIKPVGGYEVSDITIKPVQLKDPTKKCGHHDLNEKLVTETILSMFN